MKSTPIPELEKVTTLPSMNERRKVKVQMQTAKFARLANHPMQSKMKGPTGSRLRRQNFIRLSREMMGEIEGVNDHEPEKIDVCKVELWDDQETPHLVKSIPGIGKKGEQSDLEVHALASEYLEQKYPKDKWTHAFTDGSATDAVKNGGAGVHIMFKDREEKKSAATGKYATNFKSEIEAIRLASDCMLESLSSCRQNIVILTDALSVLEAFEKRSPETKPLHDSVRKLAQKSKLTLQGVPAHCGLRGNESADRLAKKGAAKPQTNKKVSYPEMKTIIKSRAKQAWSQKHPNYIANDSWNRLDRQDQVIIFRLRTGHCRLKGHLYNKMQIGDNATCPCGTSDMSVEHVLQECERLTTIRKEQWQSAVSMNEKLYGDLESLRRTAAFVKISCLDV